MAAIAGIVDFEREDAGRERLEDAIAMLPGRVFGETSLVTGTHFALAMRPLAAWFDPPVFERVTGEGRWTIVGDTRVDARDELGRALDVHREGDAALVAAAVGRWDERFAERVHGELAIAAWDASEQRLLLARDRLGARPLYYAHSGSRMAFASSPSLLLRLARLDAEPDLASVADYVVTGWIDRAGATFFRGVSAVPPAHVAVVSASGLTMSRYWDFPVACEARERREADLAEELASLLDAAVRDCLRAPRVSIQLSGGLDSTAIAAIAAPLLRARGGELSGLTMSHAGLFPDDEPRFAKEAGAFFGIPVDELRATEWTLWQGMSGSDAPRREIPGWGPLGAAWDEIHRWHASRGPVVLVGSGGDEVFVAPRRPLRWWLARGDVVGALGALGAALRRGVRPRFGLRSRGPRRGPTPVVPEWLDEEFVRQSRIRERLREDVVDEEAGRALPRPDARGFLVRLKIDRHLELCHPTFTGEPLFYAHPLLDVRLVEAVLAMPPFPWFERKLLLRRVMAGRLPDEILQRKKTGLARDPLVAMSEAGLVSDPGLGAPELDGLVRPDFRRVSSEGSVDLDMGQWCRTIEIALWRRRIAEREGSVPIKRPGSSATEG